MQYGKDILENHRVDYICPEDCQSQNRVEAAHEEDKHSGNDDEKHRSKCVVNLAYKHDPWRAM